MRLILDEELVVCSGAGRKERVSPRRFLYDSLLLTFPIIFSFVQFIVFYNCNIFHHSNYLCLWIFTNLANLRKNATSTTKVFYPR